MNKYIDILVNKSERLKKEVQKNIDFFSKIDSFQEKKNKKKFLFLNHDNVNFTDDKSKIIFSNSFRKLAYKTQVFFNNFGDYNRTRLTHSLEVAEIASSISRFFNFSSLLAECISLCHDIGHPPFGHSGEDGINMALSEYGFQKFNHNVQSVRVVCMLERKNSSIQSSGLDLSKEIIDGIIKHNGPLNKQINHLSKSDLLFLEEICLLNDIDSNKQASLQSQIASLSDDIAYTSHDIEDGFRSNFISLKDLIDLPIIGEYILNHEKFNSCNHSKEEEKIFLYDVILYLTNFMILDCIENFFHKFYELKIENIEMISSLDFEIFSFSDEMKKNKKIIKSFLFRRFYKNPELKIESIKMQKIIRKLFIFYFENNLCLPFDWQDEINKNPDQKAQIIINFIALMTDRYAIELYNKIY